MFPKKFLIFFELFHAGLFDGILHSTFGLILMIERAVEGFHKIGESSEKAKICLFESLFWLIVVVVSWKFLKGIKLVRIEMQQKF